MIKILQMAVRVGALFGFTLYATQTPQQIQNKISQIVQIQDSNATMVGEYIISQDHYDGDNFSLGLIAQNLHNMNKIRLLAFDLTGIDSNNKSGAIYSIFLKEKQNILVNQAKIEARTTDTSSRYVELEKYGADMVLDSSRKDSTKGMIEALKRAQTNSVTYYAGGHITNLEYCLRNEECYELVKQKVSRIVFASDHEGRWDVNAIGHIGAVKSTKYVLENLPKNVQFISAGGYTDDIERDYNLDISLVNNEALKYLTKHSPYYRDSKPYIRLGDFAELLWAIEPHIAEKKRTCFTTNHRGALTPTSGDCNHYIVNVPITPHVREMFLKIINFQK